MKHSKTPWTLEEPNFNETTVSIACNDGYEYIAHLTHRVSMFEDAKHIIKCVNHFDEMKAMIKKISQINLVYHTLKDEAKQLLEKLKKENDE